MIRRPPRSTLFPTRRSSDLRGWQGVRGRGEEHDGLRRLRGDSARRGGPAPHLRARSEEHTSELQSPCNLVCRLLLEKKKNTLLINHSSVSSRLRSHGREHAR